MAIANHKHLKMGVAVLLVLFMLDMASCLHMSQTLSDQLHHVELLHTSRIQRRNVIPYHTGTFVLEFYNRTFTLHLEHHYELFRNGIRVTIVGADGKESLFDLDKENYWIGTVEGDASSAVRLYISPKGFFHGRIIAFGETYVLEHAYRHYNTTEHQVDEYTVVYRARDLINKYDPHTGKNESGHSFCGIKNEPKTFKGEQVNVLHSDEDGEHNHDHDEHDDHDDHDRLHEVPGYSRLSDEGHRRRRSIIAGSGQVSNANSVCGVLVVGDSHFWANNGASASAVTSTMVTQITESSNNYQNTIWYTTSASSPVYGQNLKLAVTDVLVYSSAGTDPYAQASNGADWTGSNGPQNLLTFFSSAPGKTPQGWSGACVAHLFTHFSFDGGTLGLAWVGDPSPSRAGGVCHNSATQWLNTGWTTGVNNGVVLPTLLEQLVTQHEIGHNWGSPHDTTSDCLYGPHNGHFVMFPTAVDGSNLDNKDFSPCSIRSITGVLQAKGNCFVASANGFCGDYLVNNRSNQVEQCDSGTSGDTCCTSNCAFTPGSTCSYASDICCGSNCQPRSTECFPAFLNDPQCRASSFCNVANAKACPTPAAKAAGEPCGSAGSCDGSFANASSCVSICTKFAATACQCTSPDECHVCCIHNPSATPTSCGTPFKNYNVSGTYQCTPARTALATVTTQSCITSTYWSNIRGSPILYNATQMDPACDSTPSLCQGILDLVPNTVCSIGVCSTSGTCVVQDSNTAQNWATLSSLSFDNIQKWMKQNIVGTVLIFSFVVWLPLGCLVHRSDVRKRKENASYGMRQSSAMTFKARDLGRKTLA